MPLIFESREPGAQEWTEVNEPGFGEAGNLGIFSLVADRERLYAGTFNLTGLQVWASECRGTPPYKWRKLLDQGAGRGPLNQMVMSMLPFKGALYLGTGLQGGGNDRVNKIGPAAAELIRINSDSTWDLIVGEERDVDGKRYEPLSGLRSGFGNFFNGYVWSLVAHNGWMYAGTYDWSVMLRWSTLSESPPKVGNFSICLVLNLLSPTQAVLSCGEAGMARTGCRSISAVLATPIISVSGIFVSTPNGLFVGTGNFFGPRVAVRRGSEWVYEDNPRGGLEIWLGNDGETD